MKKTKKPLKLTKKFKSNRSEYYKPLNSDELRGLYIMSKNIKEKSNLNIS